MVRLGTTVGKSWTNGPEWREKVQGGSVTGQNRQVMGEPSGEGQDPVQSQGSEGVRGDRIQLYTLATFPIKEIIGTAINPHAKMRIQSPTQTWAAGEQDFSTYYRTFRRTYCHKRHKKGQRNINWYHQIQSWTHFLPRCYSLQRWKQGNLKGRQTRILGE